MAVPRWLSTAKPSWPDSSCRSGTSLTRSAVPPVLEQPFPTNTHPRLCQHTCGPHAILAYPPTPKKDIAMPNMELAHRRVAIQIVAQLPESQADALLILEAARDFVLKFLAEDDPEEGRGVVLSLVPPA